MSGNEAKAPALKEQLSYNQPSLFELQWDGTEFLFEKIVAASCDNLGTE